MKTSLMFRDQVNVLNNWFDAWNECEQIVAMYSLFRKLTPGPTKFLMQVLNQNSEGCVDIQFKENQANNPVCIKNLCQESKDFAVQQLLSYLPLLRSGNNEAKSEYLTIIPKILTHSIENRCHIEESRQLLSYCLIHPAITPAERSQFTVWLGHLDERNACPQSGKSQNVDKENIPTLGNDNGCQNVPSHELNKWQNIASTRDSGIGLEQFTSVGQPVSNMAYNQNADSTNVQCSMQLGHSGSSFFTAKNGNPYNSHKKLTRSTTAQPNNVSDWLNKYHEEMSQLSHQKSPQLPGSIPHAPLSPQSSTASSGSDSQEENLSRNSNSFLEDKSGMRDVPIWLKNLRLHKYSYLFQQLSYEEMLNLTEQWLESQNVTKGARHKIVLSIKKLKERQSQLQALEKDVMDSCNLKQVLQQVKSILNTPIKESTTEKADQEKSETSDDTIVEGDIPGHITRLMGKVCTQLLVNNRPDEECFAMYLQVLDKCMIHQAWGIEAKKKLASWKLQIQKIWQPTGLRQKKGFNSPMALRNLLPCQRVIRGQMPKQIGQQPSWSFANSPAAIIGSIPQTGSLPLFRNSSFNSFTSRPPLYELKPQIGRTYSVPIPKSANSLPVPDIGIMEPELAARLDSLCLSMTEHALGNIDSPEKGSTL